MYIKIYEEVFSKTQSMNLALAVQTLFVYFGMALIPFWQRDLHVYMSVYNIYIYRQVYMLVYMYICVSGYIHI